MSRGDIQERKYRELVQFFQTMPAQISTTITLGSITEMQASVDGITIPVHGITVPPAGFEEWLARFDGAKLTGQNDLFTDGVQWAVKVKVDMPRPVQHMPYPQQHGYGYSPYQSPGATPWKRIQYLTATAVALLVVGFAQTSNPSGLLSMFV